MGEPLSNCPFWDFPSHIRYVKNVKKTDGDIAQVLTGDEGSGKSEAALTFMLYLNRRFDLNHVIFDQGDLMETVDSLIEGGDYVFDEAGTLLFSRDHSTKESKDSIKMFQTDRFLNLNRIFVLPDKRWIDVYLRTHRIKIWIHVTAEHTINGIVRGKADVRWLRKFFSTDSQEIESRWEYVYEWNYSRIVDGPWRKQYLDRKKLRATENFIEAIGS